MHGDSNLVPRVSPGKMRDPGNEVAAIAHRDKQENFVLMSKRSLNSVKDSKLSASFRQIIKPADGCY